MDKPLHPEPPYFDPAGMRRELTRLFNEAGNAKDARPLIVERLRGLLRDGRAAARAALELDGDGQKCSEGLSRLEDEMVRLVFDYATAHLYRATNPSDSERMAVVATGGYGRGRLAPGSDIDLLFLLPYKQTPWGESVAESMLYILWDLGQKVGHATRNVDQCLRMAETDFTIRTALLDARFICGDQQLYEELVQRFRSDVIQGSARAFIDAKMAERDDRHKRTGLSRYLVEPNVKDGKGGLRDLHTLHWLAKYLHGADISAAADTAGVFSPAEVATFRKCENFLWSVRCHLHFLTGRAEERLTFDLQPTMAERLGYRDGNGLRAVERFMKHYFLIAKEVGELTRVLSNALEVHQLKSTPALNRLFNPSTWRTRRHVRQRTDFRIDNDRLNVADTDAFKRDPVNILRFFAVAAETGSDLHPAALRLVRSSLRRLDDIRDDAEANRLFLDLLCSRGTPEVTLRQMNETGVLGRFIPEYGRVVSMMQFNMYHHYTVDEHLLRTVGELTAIERGALKDVLPLSTKIVGSIQNRRALYVAAFLHDIGKGRIEDHSLVGARIARELAPRFGLTPAEVELVVWLIAEHLTMSNVAQTRDLSDPRTITDFAAIVQSPERLKLLLLLTVADIRAVGPGTWNGWKGQLLRTLYYEAEPIVAGGHTERARIERVGRAQEQFRNLFATWPETDIQAFVDRQYADYWLKTDLLQQVEHARLMRDAERNDLKLATSYKTDTFTSVTEFNVLAPNHPRLLSLFAGACAAAGANIVGASVSTTRDGRALDTFRLQRAFQLDEDEERRAKRIGSFIERMLKGEVRLEALMEKRRPEPKVSAFTVAPEVVINNALSDQFTVIEVAGLDRPGLLYDLTSTLSDLSLDITSAHVTTYGEKAVDVFYVTDLTGKKIAETRHKLIRQRLEDALSGPTGQAATAAAPVA
jgi:[protein-PII] uridylyltransferase